MTAALFDWDGTLLDSLPALYRANVEVMAAFGLPFDEHGYRRGFAADWRRMYRQLGIPDDGLETANAVWQAAFDGGASAELLPGARDALDRLAEAGRPLGLVTAGHRSIVAPQLERHGLVDRFDVVVFGDDLPVHKPDPRPLLQALDRLGLAATPEAAVYLGDTRDDMRMARAAGARAVGIASLLGEPDDLLAAGAEAIHPSVAAWTDEALGVAHGRLEGRHGTAQRSRRRVGAGVLPPPSEHGR